MNKRVMILVWCVGLIFGWVLVLDERKHLAELQASRLQTATAQPRLWAAGDFESMSSAIERAKVVQKDWSQRLPLVARTGAFRAQGMERAAAMCRELEMACQISAVGEGPAAVAGPSPAASSVEGAPQAVANVLATTVKLSFPLDAVKLPLLLRRLERSDQLTFVESVVVRTARVELVVRFYGQLTQDALSPVSQVTPLSVGSTLSRDAHLAGIGQSETTLQLAMQISRWSASASAAAA